MGRDVFIVLKNDKQSLLFPLTSLKQFYTENSYYDEPTNMINQLLPVITH